MKIPIKPHHSRIISAFYLIATLSLFQLASGSVDQPQETLETIDSLSYEVTGVERASQILGAKIAINIKPEVLIPTLPRAERPGISSNSVWIPPSHPEKRSEPGAGYYQCRIDGGGFGNYGLSLEGITRISGSTIQGEGWYAHPPRLVEPGSVSDGGFRLAGIISPWNVVTLTPAVKSSIFSYQLDDVDNSNMSWNDIRFELGLSRISSPLGELTASALYGYRKYSDAWEMRIINGDYNLMVISPVGSGLLKTWISYASESFEDAEDNIELFKIKAFYDWWLGTRFKLGLGLNGYRGSSQHTGNSEWFRPLLKLAWVPAFGGLLEARWIPEITHESRNSLHDTYPMISRTTCGSLLEDVVHASLSYNLQTTSGLEFTCEADYRDTRHFPLLVFDQSADEIQPWGIDNYRVRTSSFTVQGEVALGRNAGVRAYSTFQVAEIVRGSNNDEVPDVTPLEAGLTGALYLYNLSIENTFSWNDVTPLTFDGKIERPAYLDWGMKFLYPIKSNWKVGLVLENLLNQHAWDVPGYDFPPFHFQLNVLYRGTL